MTDRVVFYGPAAPPHHTFAPFYTRPENWLAATLAVNNAADGDLYLYAYARRPGWPVYTGPTVRRNPAADLDQLLAEAGLRVRITEVV